MGDPAMAAARDEAQRLGTIVGSDVDRVEDELLRELAHEALPAYQAPDPWPRCSVCLQVCVFDLTTRSWRHRS